MPLREEFAKALHGRRILVAIPNKNERHGLGGTQRDEAQQRACGAYEFGDHTNTSACLDIGHDRADEAWRLREGWNDASAAASSNNGIVKTHAFAACENDQR
jgi:hypothetical protein